jgi:predicted CDP-diglyceride synthetase/phosphatidate cytidylyltransferase
MQLLFSLVKSVVEVALYFFISFAMFPEFLQLIIIKNCDAVLSEFYFYAKEHLNLSTKLRKMASLQVIYLYMVLLEMLTKENIICKYFQHVRQGR